MVLMDSFSSILIVLCLYRSFDSQLFYTIIGETFANFELWLFSRNREKFETILIRQDLICRIIQIFAINLANLLPPQMFLPLK